MTNQVVTLINNEGTNLYPVAGALKQGSVTTSTINDGAVTYDKLNLASMLFGNYSSSEINTGFTWVDGNYIYKKTIYIGNLPNNTTKSVNHNISNIGAVIKFEGWGNRPDTTDWFPLPMVSTTDTNQVTLVVSTTAINISCGIDRSSAIGYVTLYYTKSS